METSNSEPKKSEQMFRMYFRKQRSTKKNPKGKIVYKDIWACSRKDAIEIAKDMVRNGKKELELLSEK